MQALTEFKSLDQVEFSYCFHIGSYFETDIGIILLESSWTHVREVPNTKLLVSLHHRDDETANMAVYDISRQDKINEVYSG